MPVSHALGHDGHSFEVDMPVCVTGIAGFIGFHTAMALASQGRKVVGFDNFNAFYDTQLKKDRAALLKRETGIECEIVDLSDSKSLERFFDHHKPSAVIHLAGQPGVRYSVDHPHEVIQSNITGFLNLLEILKKTPSVPLIYASSSSIYGMNRKVPFAEEDPTDHPASLYGATKKANELMAYAYHHLYKIPMTGLRFFTVYGPWGRPDMAAWIFTKAIFEGTPIRLFNEGKMKRDFTYIDDIVQGVLAALEQSAPYAIYNLGGSHCYDLKEFVATIEKTVGKKANIELEPMQLGDVLATHADIGNSMHQLHFIPRTPLEPGISKFVSWYKQYHGL